MRTAIDVSNYQPRDLSNLIQTYAPDVIIIRIQLPTEHIPPGYTHDQAASAHAWNIPVQAYVWGYGDADPVWTMVNAVRIYREISAQGPLWLDCEADIDEDWVRDAIVVGEALGVTVGIYTGFWWWQSHIVGDFGHLPLWVADYGSTSPRLPHGWDKYVWWQWTSDPIDQNVGVDGMRTEQQQRIIDVLRINANDRLQKHADAATMVGLDSLARELVIAIDEINGEVDKLENSEWPVG